MEKLSKYLTDGLLYEFSIDEKEKIDLADMYVSVIQLFLSEYLNTEDTALLLRKLNMLPRLLSTSMVEERITEFCSLLFRCIKRKANFRDIDELLNLVSSVSVPEWVVDNYKKLIELFPDFYVYDKHIYYCDRSGEISHLCSLGCEYLENIDVIDYDGLGLSEKRPKRILENIDGILGFQQQYVYLSNKNLSDAFICFDLSLGQSTIIYHKYVGSMSGNPVVLNEESYVGILHGKDEIQWIGEVEENKQISVFDEKILEEGKFPYFCLPSFWDSEGNVSVADDAFLRAYLCIKLLEGTYSTHKYEQGLNWKPLTKSRFEACTEVPEILSIHSILDFFHTKQSKMELYSDKSYMLMEKVFSIVDKYFARENDIIDPLCILLFTSFQMNNKKQFCFTQELYDYLKIFSEKEEFQPKNEEEKEEKFYLLLNQIMEETMYWTDKKINEKNQKNKTIPYVGCFTLLDNRIGLEKVSLDRAKCFGNYRMFMPKDTTDKGFVIYDMMYNRFIIQYHKSLSANVIATIKKSFGLRFPHRIHIQR